MQLIEIALSNIGSYERAAYQFAPMQVVLGANGSGKSTLTSRAILWCLFGEAVGPADNIVRRGADLGQVELTLAVKGNRYRIIRTRSKRGRGLSRLEVQLASADGWVPLTRGTISETQRFLETDVLGLGYLAFVASAAIVQGQPHFLQYSPPLRKTILSSLLQIDEVYGSLKERALQAQRRWESDATTLTRHVDECRTASELVELKTPDLQAASAALEVATQTVRTLEAQLSELQERIAHLNAQSARATDLTARRTAIQGELASMNGEMDKAAVRRQELEAARSRRDQVARDLASLVVARHQSAEYSHKRQAHDRLAEEEREFTEAVHAAVRAHEQFTQESASLIQRAETATGRLRNSGCPIIDQRPQCVFLKDAFQQATALPELVRARQETEDELSKKVIAARNDRAAARRRIEKLGYRADAHARADTEVARLAVAERQMVLIESAEAQIAELAERVQQLAATVEAKEAEDLRTLQEIVRIEDVAAELVQLVQSRTGTAAALTRAREEERRLLREVASLQTLLDQLRHTAAQLEPAVARCDQAAHEAYLYKELAKAYGPDGIPARIMDNAVGDLAMVANQLLERMPASGQTFRCELRTTRMLKSAAGERETLDVHVFANGEETPTENLSGGERVRIGFALQIGMGRLAAHRAGAEVRTLLIDEAGFGELDRDGRRALIEAIHSVSDDFDTIVMVSHVPEIQEAGWPVIAEVKKEDGISTVMVA